jgi:hypothetical protein
MYRRSHGLLRRTPHRRPLTLLHRSGIWESVGDLYSGARPNSARRFAFRNKKRRPLGPPFLQKLGLIYALLRRRRPSQPKPTSAEPRSVKDAGSGAVIELASKTAGRLLTSAYHRS